jgi:hypothetical protein
MPGLKFLNVCLLQKMTETSDRIKINWITNKIEMIGILKINSRQ